MRLSSFGQTACRLTNRAPPPPTPPAINGGIRREPHCRNKEVVLNAPLPTTNSRPLDRRCRFRASGGLEPSMQGLARAVTLDPERKMGLIGQDKRLSSASTSIQDIANLEPTLHSRATQFAVASPDRLVPLSRRFRSARLRSLGGLDRIGRVLERSTQDGVTA